MEQGTKARKYRSETEWREVVRRQAESGQSVSEFCATEGINKSLLYEWRKRLGGGKRRSALKGNQFIEVAPPSTCRPESLIELELPAGIVLRVRG